MEGKNPSAGVTPPPTRPSWRLRCIGAATLALWVAARAGTPQIDLIEPFLTDQVLIHFETEANYAYELQYTESLSNGVPVGPWTNLYLMPKLPFGNHYVWPDTRLRAQRFYRLRAYQ